MIEPFVMLGIIATAILLVYYLKHRETKGKYLWVGHGDDPFKERK